MQNYCVWDLCLRDVSEEDVRLRGSRVIDVSVSDVRVRIFGGGMSLWSIFVCGIPGTSGLSFECLFADCFTFEMSM